jgi:hypothetical protein
MPKISASIKQIPQKQIVVRGYARYVDLKGTDIHPYWTLKKYDAVEGQLGVIKDNDRGKRALFVSVFFCLCVVCFFYFYFCLERELVGE